MFKIVKNTLIVRVDARDLLLIAGSLPTSGSCGCDSCMFLFMDDKWADLERSAVFWQDKNRRFEVPLTKGSFCEIPPQALAEDGWLFVGVIGRKKGVLQNSKVLLVPLREGTREGNVPGDAA